ncbi:MAG: DNA-3-methyladenine glycosylase [Frankiales bacterium]|nr:DNA-3-methyladenine glycosylase [Frankiales bacterium]
MRCAWADSTDLMRDYHDTEWGMPSHDDRYLFELITLEGAQAGLSWSTVLNKRAHYRQVLDGFEPAVIVSYDEAKLAELVLDPGIIRHRLKIQSLVTNAAAFLQLQAEHGRFADYLWAWVDDEPLSNRPRPGAALPARTELSDRVSKDLKKRGFRFVGSTIVYSYLQAVGVIDDHASDCPYGPAARRET